MYQIEADIDGRPCIVDCEPYSELETYEREKEKERRGENKILYYLSGIVLLIVYIYLYYWHYKIEPLELVL